MKGFGPAILAELPMGSPEWFSIVNETILSNDLDLRQNIIFQILHKDVLQKGPRYMRYLDIMLHLLDKGTIDEKREIITFIRDNPALFDPNNENLMGRITVAQRETDPRIANTAEEALKILKGITE